jgi:hypothetical protein
MHKILRSAVVLALFVSTTMLGVRAEAAESSAQEAAYGAGSVFTTLLYAPAKTGFCLVGAATSGLTLPFGGTDMAGKVATAACGGTWTITPDTLRGKEPLRFIGGDGKR